MSFYQKDKYRLSNHAKWRIKQRFFKNQEFSEIDLNIFLESVFSNISLDFCTSTNEEVYINHELKIKLVITKDLLIKTIIKIK